MPHRAGRRAFQIGLIGLGTVSVVTHDFLKGPQPIPGGWPGYAILAVLSGLLLIATGVGLSLPASARTASRILFGYFVLWMLLLDLPPVILPQTAVITLAAWLLLAAGRRSPRLPRTLAGLALIPIGLSHFFYFQVSLTFVPTWAPSPALFVALTGAGHIAAGLGLLFGVVPRLAALMEAAMVIAFALLVWIPRIVASPADLHGWAAFWITWAVGAAAWVVADSYPEAGASTT
jgi:uncharacterized membrane protein